MNWFSRYNASKSRYYYKDTEVLINKLDIRDNNLLREADAAFSAQRLVELQAQPITGNFDLEHLKDIHRYIFKDIYRFAGKIREEDISKGHTRFSNCFYIRDNANKIFSELAGENFLQRYSLKIFCSRVSYYMAELNILHPFREGNGRAIRELVRCLALKCGYEINWKAINQKELLEASIKSVLDIADLVRCIEKGTSKI